MPDANRLPCPDCQRLQAQLDELRAVVERLQAQLASARKNSATSSKPPSSDLVKPPKPTAATGDGGTDGKPRRLGGQPGHQQHLRAPFPAAQVTAFAEHTLAACPHCGGPLRHNGGCARVVQQVDVERPPLRVEQHTCPEYWCDGCNHSARAPLPARVEAGGLLGPHLTTLVAYLKGVCHASYSTVRLFLRDVVGLTVSRGQLAKVIGKASAALAETHQQLLEQLPGEPVLNVDETSHRDRGELFWTWCFRAHLYTAFKIDPTRSADVLIDVLGKEFDGVLGCDCFGAYRRFMREFDVRLQLCLAHLIREVKYLTTLPDEATRSYGERFRESLRELFSVLHRRGERGCRRRTSRPGWTRPGSRCFGGRRGACRRRGRRGTWRRGWSSTGRATSGSSRRRGWSRRTTRRSRRSGSW